MIATKLSGGLGNNLFQYSITRLIAKNSNKKFVYFNVVGIKYLFRYVRSSLHSIVFKSSKIEKQVNKSNLENFFILDNETNLSLILKRLIFLCLPCKVNLSLKKLYDLNEITSLDRPISIERLTNAPVILDHSYSSELLFFGNRNEILKTFKPKEFLKRELDQFFSNLSVPAHLRCAIHIRRGDALISDKGFAYQDIGWSLPLEYYKKAISELPQNLFFILISDDPDWVDLNFSFLKEKIIPRNRSDAFDLLCFSYCKYNVIARSTFSWWGAYLNQNTDKVIIGPKYCLGINQKIWAPEGINLGPESSSYKYIDVSHT